MHTTLSNLGLFHTAISVLSIGAGFYAFFRDGKVDQKNQTGKFYLWTMLIASFTAFGITPHGFRVGHVLSLVTLAILFTAMAAGKTHWFGRASAYVETISFSTSFFLLMVFATTETLTRLPASQPIAASPDAPVLGAVRLGLLVAYAAGVVYQVLELRNTNHVPTTLGLKAR